MTDLLPLRAAAGGGSVDGLDAARLVAAGFTLLQRSAPLVRALAGRRSAILLPNSAQYLVALAASDGRGALLIDPTIAPDRLADRLRDARVGAVFTTSALAERYAKWLAGPRADPLDEGPGGAPLVQVFLDDAPVSALVHVPGRDPQRVDLGSHYGLELSGDAAAPGRDEECVVVHPRGGSGASVPVIHTHRDLIAMAERAAAAAQAAGLTRGARSNAHLPFWEPAGLVEALMAPLFAGAQVSTRES